MKNKASNQIWNTWRLAPRLLGLSFVACLLGIASSARGGTVAYSYDALNRLTKASYLDNTAITYDYDSVDNWTTNTVTVATDSDADGIPDWWMNQYFGHPTGQAGDNSRATDDADGDGMTNLQEFLAGTSPIDPGSVLRISSAVPQGSDMVFTFATATNRQYLLEWTTDLNSGVWTSLPDVISGDGTVQQVRHGGGATLPQRFYRIRLLD
jgi:hypothetical protein